MARLHREGHSTQRIAQPHLITVDKDTRMRMYVSLVLEYASLRKHAGVRTPRGLSRFKIRDPKTWRSYC